MTTTIHIRDPVKLKKAAQRVAEANGLDLSSAIRVYLTHMEVRGILPLPSLTVNGFTEEEENEIVRRAQEPVIPIDDIGTFLQSCRSN